MDCALCHIVASRKVFYYGVHVVCLVSGLDHDPSTVILLVLLRAEYQLLLELMNHIALSLHLRAQFLNPLLRF